MKTKKSKESLHSR